MVKESSVKETEAANTPRIGVFVCECGVNIGGVVNCRAVADYASTLPNVATSVVNKYACSDAGAVGDKTGHKGP